MKGKRGKKIGRRREGGETDDEGEEGRGKKEEEKIKGKIAEETE